MVDMYCNCVHPMIRCDATGCRCMMCHLLEDPLGIQGAKLQRATEPELIASDTYDGSFATFRIAKQFGVDWTHVLNYHDWMTGEKDPGNPFVVAAVVHFKERYPDGWLLLAQTINAQIAAETTRRRRVNPEYRP